MEEFEKIYKNYVGRQIGINHEQFHPLLQSIYDEVRKNPINRTQLKNKLNDLINFLNSKEGATSPHCIVTDLFFQDIDELWVEEISNLDKDFKEIFDEFCFLHGAIKQPEYHTTPEQLKGMIEKINT